MDITKVIVASTEVGKYTGINIQENGNSHVYYEGGSADCLTPALRAILTKEEKSALLSIAGKILQLSPDNVSVVK